MPRLNGGQVIARILKEYGVPYVAGIPGHGIWGLMDAFNEDESKIPFIQTYHEQSAERVQAASRQLDFQRVTSLTGASVRSVRTLATGADGLRNIVLADAVRRAALESATIGTLQTQGE